MPPFSIENDRLMLCGSPDMLKEIRVMLEERGFEEGNMSEPGHFVLEKAFVG
ncbi:Ferredoxin--NADP reductase [compost metagenome]